MAKVQRNVLLGKFTTWNRDCYYQPARMGEATVAPTIAAQMMGSVGVRQAETARHEMRFSLGNKTRSRPGTPFKYGMNIEKREGERKDLRQ